MQREGGELDTTYQNFSPTTVAGKYNWALGKAKLSREEKAKNSP